jgi:type IV secretion system protein VirB6
MGLVTDVLTSVHSLLSTYVKDSYDAFIPQFEIIIHSLAGVSLVLVALNHIYQARQIPYSTYFAWIIRYLCIVAFVTGWANFDALMKIITNVPIAYGSVLIPEVKSYETVKKSCDPKRYKVRGTRMTSTDSTGIFGIKREEWLCETRVEVTTPVVASAATVYELIDQVLDTIFDIAKELAKNVKSIKSIANAFYSAAVFLIGGLLALSSLFVLLSADIGLHMMFALGPLAIVMLTFQQTRGYFESWLRLTVGFAVVPMMVTVVMALISRAAMGQVGDDIGNINDVINFLVVSAAAVPFLFQVPQLASSLASVSLPQMGGASIAHGARSMMAMASNTIAPVDNARERMRAGGMALSRAMNLRDGGVAGKQANPVRAAAKAMMQSAGYRQHRMGVKSQENYRQSEARQHKEAYRQWQAGGRQGPAPQWQNRKTDRFGGRYNRGGAAVSGGDAGGGAGGGGFGSGNQAPIGTDLDYINPNHNR